MQLKLVHKEKQIIHVRSEGEITMAATDHDADPLEELLGLEVYSQTVVWNLEDSDYLSSNGIGWLLRCHKRFENAGGKLVMHSVPPLVMETLKLMRLHRQFEVVSDEVAALAIVGAES